MSLLTPNSTPLMRAFEASALRDLPVQIDVWNPQTCAEHILPWLAWALHITDSEGWAQAETVQDKRNLLSASFALHRRKGTVQSVKDALAAIGFGSQSRLIEGGIRRSYNGTYKYDGSIKYTHPSWAEYSIEADLGENTGISADTISRIIKTCDEYAPVRCHLAGITFAVHTSEIFYIPAEEAFAVNAQIDSVDQSQSEFYQYDGARKYDGSIRAGNNNDISTVVAHYSETSYFGAVAKYDGSLKANGFGDYGSTSHMIYELSSPMFATRTMRYNGKHKYNGSLKANSGIPVEVK